MERSNAWKAISRKYTISCGITGPYYLHQNRNERYIQELKKITTRIMDHNNLPDYLCYEVLQYSPMLHIHTSK